MTEPGKTELERGDKVMMREDRIRTYGNGYSEFFPGKIDDIKSILGNKTAIVNGACVLFADLRLATPEEIEGAKR